MIHLQALFGPAARRPRPGRWAPLCFVLFCMGFAAQIPSATSAAPLPQAVYPRQDATPVPSPTPTCEQRCNVRAHEVYAACIAMGRGPDACEKEASTAREICMRECPKPTAVPSCEAKCGQRAEEVFKACIAAGRGEEACHKEAGDAKAACLRECPRPAVTATPKPDVSRCEQFCAGRAEEVYKACIAAGRGPDVCEGEAKTAREKCIANECPKPEPTRVPGCEEKCKHRFEEVYQACIAAGRGPDACENEARAAKEACLKECPRDATKTPVPEAKTCEQRCGAHAEEVYKACIAAGRGPDACENEARAAKDACLKECPRDLPATPKPDERSCEQRCKARLEEVYKACIAAGRGPDACEKEAKQAQETCLKECPRRDATKTPQPPSCEGRCKEHAAAEFKACIQGGGDEKTCHERSNKVLADCLTGCPKPEPKPDSCRARCNEKAAAAYKACRERGAGEEDCLEEKTRAFNACMAACERPVESCEAGCKQRAEAGFKACLAEGIDETVCRERMRAALEVCLKSCPQPQPVGCQERCAGSAREVLAKCLADGGGQEACEARAKEAYDACFKHCERPVPPAPIADCSTKCARAGAAVFQRCLADGGTVEGCTERMAQEIQRCLTECLRPATGPADQPLVEPRRLRIDPGR